MRRQSWNPEQLNKPRNYSQAVSVRGGRTIYIAGQTPCGSDGEAVCLGDLKGQMRVALRNLQIALEAAGASMNDVVQLRTHVVGYCKDVRHLIIEARGEFFKEPYLPASSVFGTTELSDPELLVEVDAVAVVFDD